MSESTQPYDTAPLVDSAGHIDHEALRARVEAALLKTEPPRPFPRHFTIERVGSEIRVSCWCGKARTLSVEHINVFCKHFNYFLEEHSLCEPGEPA